MLTILEIRDLTHGLLSLDDVVHLLRTLRLLEKNVAAPGVAKILKNMGDKIIELEKEQFFKEAQEYFTNKESSRCNHG